MKYVILYIVFGLCTVGAQSRFQGAEAFATDGQGNLVALYPQRAEVAKCFGPAYDSCIVYGGRNQRADGLIRPTDIAMPVGQRLYVLDGDRRKLLLLNTDLKLSGEVPLPTDETGLPMPVAAFAASANGQFALLNPLTNRITIIDENGNLLREIGGLDYGEGRLLAPVSLCADEKGSLYVLDTADHSLVIFNPFGQARKRLLLPAGNYNRVRLLGETLAVVGPSSLLFIHILTEKMVSKSYPNNNILDIIQYNKNIILLTINGIHNLN